GAGKTTFFNLISGELEPTEGEVFFKGQSLQKKSSVDRTRLGIGRSFQITNVFPNLTVLENVRLAVQSKRKVRFHMLNHFLKYKNNMNDAFAILQLVILTDKMTQVDNQLSHRDKRKPEVGILLELDTEILLFDQQPAAMYLAAVPAILDAIRSNNARGD